MKFNQVTRSNNTGLNKPIPAKKHVSQPERQKYVELWQQSDLSQKVFCEQHDINPKNFYRWRRSSVPGNKKGALVKKNKKETVASESKPLGFKCRLPNGAILSFDGYLEIAQLSSIIKEVSSCKFN